MIQYMLDTNTVSYLLKAHPTVVGHVTRVPITSLCISAVTQGELLFGLAKRPDAKRLHRAVDEFLRRVDVLPWNSDAAATYGTARAELTRQGLTLAPLDLLIATHALSTGAVLVTNDRAFSLIASLKIEDWSV